ncbi:hypothetical protein EWM64_g9951 [Hericium alpestre]|uniref:Uncharacterized protein n=1 Tax=Hericium alpestre TaxID=135208 RepID=A0A4Y9ZJN6_9AGAM|nr:hypothetical protein EWM64_g9951 [Hericium alpestre]
MPPGARVHPIPDRHPLDLDLDPTLVISAFILCLALAKRGLELYFVLTTSRRNEMPSYKKSSGAPPADTAAKKSGAGVQVRLVRTIAQTREC